MAGEIKQKIVLEGEKEYNSALKEAQRNLRTLKSELKAETAELGRNATEQQKAEAKAKSLQKQIQQQEKVVSTYRKALEEVRAKYGDNQDAVQEWERKLNNARATLATMQNDLEGVSGSLDQVSDSMNKAGNDAAKTVVATKSVADSLQSLGAAGDAVAGAIEGIFFGMIDVVGDAVSQLWDMISETAAKANNWTDIAGYWGTDAQTIQQYARAVKASANSFDDLQSAVSKIVMGGKGDKITELLGVSGVNYKNEWDYAIAVLNEIHRMRQDGKNTTPIMEEIFGEKKSTKVLDLLNDWNTILELLPQFNGNETGFGMSDEELKTMDSLWVEINRIETKWESIKENIAGGFGQVTMDLLVNVEGTLDGIADYLNAKDDGEKQAALQKIRDNVEEFFRKVADLIRQCAEILKEVGKDLSDSDDPLTQFIGGIMQGLADALGWIVDNQEAVINALKAIFGAWLIAKLTAVAGKLSSIVAQIEAIKAFKGLGSAGAAAGAESSAAGGGFLSGFSRWIASALPSAANWMSVNGGPVWDWLTNESPFASLLKGQESVGEFLSRTGAEVQKNASTFTDDWTHLGDADYRKNTEENEWGLTEDQTHYLRLFYQAYTHLQRDGKLSDFELGNYNEAGKKLPELFTGQEDLLQYYMEKMLTYGNTDGLLGDDFFQRIAEETAERFEEIELEEREPFTEKDREFAVQDWWDAWRNAANGDDSWDEEASAFSWFEEVFGDEFGEVYDRIIAELDKLSEKEQLGLEDLPADWWMVTSNWGGNSGSADENGITSADLASFRGLPAGIQSAVARGAAQGVSGIKVNLDGRAVGELIAPFVSQAIARDILVIP